MNCVAEPGGIRAGSGWDQGWAQVGPRHDPDRLEAHETEAEPGSISPAQRAG
jgi:hypothetical protein